MKSKKQTFCYVELYGINRLKRSLKSKLSKNKYFIKNTILKLKNINSNKIILICTLIILMMLTLFNVLVAFEKKAPDNNYYMLLNTDGSYNSEFKEIYASFKPLDERNYILGRMSEISSRKVSQTTLEAIYNESVILEDKYGIPKELIISIISVESQFFVKAHNNVSDATGLMQICEPALKDYNIKNGTNLEMEDMYNIQNNMDVGTWTIKQQMIYLESDNIRDVVISYNTGIGDFKRFRDYWYKGINIKNNKEYLYYENVKNNLESLVKIPRNS